MEETKKLYSQKTISLATFLGGPLAAAIVIRRNYLNLNQEDKALKTIIAGILITAVLLFVLFQIPEGNFDRISQFVLPFIYTSVTYYIVEKLQGADLKRHEENNGEFYSNWSAAGVGLLVTVILLATIFGTVYIAQRNQNFDFETYDKEVAKFVANESNAIAVFGRFETSTTDYLLKELSKGVVLWKENKRVVEKLNAIENLPAELLEQNAKLLKYCDLRIQHNELIIKAIIEETGQYDFEIEKTGLEINRILEELQ
ncbi:hypothetical protein [Sunxiuqinia rutila]|uniref:hypothetical protein n=1 Tax=Sunxiuqinia rutila TaxID=1397841 RepID=UPI003D368D99